MVPTDRKIVRRSRRTRLRRNWTTVVRHDVGNDAVDERLEIVTREDLF